MGGSFALALKQAGLVLQVVGYSKSPTTTERARQLGVIDVEAPSALLAVSGADIVLLAVPVAATEDTFKGIRHLLGPNTLVMDVGSTKCDVVAAARTALKEHLAGFVPAHPIAGKELAGVEHADAALYQGRQVILTPLPETDPGKLAQAAAVWRALGAQVLQMDPTAHDAAFAAVSHFPHLLAFAAVNALTNQAHGQHFLSLAGPGFRDFSRIAASDPSMWRDVLLANRQELQTQIGHFQAALSALEAAMQAGDGQGLRELIQRASDTRAAWQMGQLGSDLPPPPLTSP